MIMCFRNLILDGANLLLIYCIIFIVIERSPCCPFKFVSKFIVFVICITFVLYYELHVFIKKRSFPAYLDFFLETRTDMPSNCIILIYFIYNLFSIYFIIKNRYFLTWILILGTEPGVVLQIIIKKSIIDVTPSDLHTASFTSHNSVLNQDSSTEPV